ncbi:hypothetical protein UA08_08948 [Talaromyces atroroseus]|uniref:Increased recombination centers protein 6 n=1 Tax=Talaromyces atroroseus TaxID=1441469 RepID=A0A225A6A8_TALAT|nr:hypothetical protein UA08_08948 [Talaromyces atroroseus]OKL55892.1 hypothetical protein UA08_08948 [Talaromyces atroroseus]
MPSSAAATATPSPKRITNPRRLLILTPTSHSNQTIPVLLQSLTGVLPAITPESSAVTTTADNKATTLSFAGYTTHNPLQISNKYYTADIPIWVDEIPLASSFSLSSPKKEKEEEEATQWKTSFLSREAREVRDAIGAILICVRNPKSLISGAVPREAYDEHHLSEFSSSSDRAEEVSRIISENNKDPVDRGDVEVIKDLVSIVGELKTTIEEERNGLEGREEEEEEEEEEEIGQLQGTAEVPGLLVVMDEHSSSSSSSSSPPRKRTVEDDDDDDGVDALEPFTPPWWEERLYDMGIYGFEVISWTPPSGADKAGTETQTESRNIYGELEGLPRIKEVLSTHEWGNTSLTDYNNNDDDDIMAFLAGTDRRATAEESDGFRLEVNQLEREMMGLRFAINEASRDADADDDNNSDDREDAEEELQVDNLETLMMRMKAIKDISSDLPETKRKAFAAKAVRDIMREL